MNKQKLTLSVVFLIILTSTTLFPFSSAQVTTATLSPPPTPPYILTVPKINEITYVISVKNINASWVTIDFAIPRTWIPDTYVQLRDIKIIGATTLMNYTDRENARMRAYTAEFKPGESIAINITFYSLKYKLEYSTHQPMIALGYPNEYTLYTQPEDYIQSNDTLIISKAKSLVGNRTNPFRIAERMYDFVLSYVTYKFQHTIRGALWAIQNGTGDCTEFGTLFVALMRAVGIPARTVVGHVSKALSRGGIANASRDWVDSPHLWAEFYVEGYGWVPADPTFGRNDPAKHFATTWADYLPIIKGPTMNQPYHSLASVQHPASTKVDYTSYLVVTPLTSLPFEDKALQDFVMANNRTNMARRVANKAYDYSFNITPTYPLLESTFSSLINAARAMEAKNSTLSSQYSMIAASNANQTLNMISNVVMNEAQLSINEAWHDFRILGALGGENYLRTAKNSQNNGDYMNMVQNTYYARATADQAPNILIFVGPLLFCIFTVLMIRRKNHKTKSVSKHDPATNL